MERCRASVLGWEEPPEELLLNLSQAVCLWGNFANGTVYTASKEHQGCVGVTCQQIYLVSTLPDLQSTFILCGQGQSKRTDCWVPDGR